MVDNLWEQFCISGKISDYLLYKNAVGSIENGEMTDADNNEWDSDKGKNCRGE